MKHLLSTLLCLLLASTVSATILRVNNTVGSSAPYSDLLTAHAAAQNGDTIYVEGSSLVYGTFSSPLVVTKQLVFIGPGYFLLENPCPPASLPAVVHTFILRRTVPSVPTSGGAGTEIRGLSFTAHSSSRIDVEVSNALIAQCEVNGSVNIPFTFDDVSNTTVLQNYFKGSGLVNHSANSGLNNITFANNIVEDDFNIADNSSGSILHNLFLDNSFDVVSFNGEIRSNISTSTSTTNFMVSTTGQGNTSHNTAANGQFGSMDNNNVAPPNALFIGASGNSTDGQYQLLPTATAALANAHDGTDRGPFGGNLPYVLSGLPDIPYILFLETNSPNFPSILLNVTVRAKSGN